MPKAPKTTFDPKNFLAKVGDGKTILKFDKCQVFSQGDAQIPSSISRRDRSRFSSSPSKARKQWSESWSPDNSSGKVA